MLYNNKMVLFKMIINKYAYTLKNNVNKFNIYYRIN